MTGGSGSGKTNSLFNPISQQPDIDKFYLYAKEPYKAKYQFLVNKSESTGIKHFNDSKAFNGSYLQRHWRIQPKWNQNILIVFDDMIVDSLSN